METRTASLPTTTPSARVDEPGAAGYINMSKAFLRKRRREGKPPDYYRLGRRIVYDLADLDAFLQQSRVRPSRTRV